MDFDNDIMRVFYIFDRWCFEDSIIEFGIDIIVILIKVMDGVM